MGVTHPNTLKFSVSIGGIAHNFIQPNNYLCIFIAIFFVRIFIVIFSV